jgi:hypothetical protein
MGGAHEWQKAAVAAQALIARQPQHARYLALAAEVDYRLGHWQLCIDKLQTASDHDLTDAGAARLFLLAMARHQRKMGEDVEQARKDFHAAVELMSRESNGEAAMIQLRDEAAALLAVTPQPPSAAAGVSRSDR